MINSWVHGFLSSVRKKFGSHFGAHSGRCCRGVSDDETISSDLEGRESSGVAAVSSAPGPPATARSGGM